MMALIQSQQKEITNLKRQLEDAQNAMKNYELKIEEAGTLAEASAKLNDLFEAAQATADTYLENVKKLEERAQEKLDEVEKQSELVIAEAENVALKRIAAADAEVTKREIEGSEIVAEAERKSQKLISDAEEEVDEKWNLIEERLLKMYESHQGLKEMVESGIFSFPKDR